MKKMEGKKMEGKEGSVTFDKLTTTVDKNHSITSSLSGIML